MATTESFAYPIFTKGQQLKSSDLNNITAYVELEDRLTRAQFIGTGIMNGLEVSWVEDDNGKRLVIGKGAGISSMGYLLYQAEDVAFTKYKETELLLSEILENNSSDKFPVWKLTDAGDKNLDTIFPLADDCKDVTCNKCLLALKEINISSTNGGCFNGLETESKKANFEIVYYLVDHSLLDKLETLLPAGEYKISFKELSSPFFPRLGLESGGLNLAKIQDLAKFKEAFTTVCQEGIDSLNRALVALKKDFGKDLDLDETIKFDTLQVDLEAALAKSAEGNGHKLPYFYEFLEDLVKAYQELVSMGEVTIVYPTVNVEEDWFPHHLLLGGFGNLKSKCRTPKYCASNCNHPPAGNGEKARFLYRRLNELIKNTSFDELASTPKIVPGKSYDHTLSDRAIPFYYKPVVRPSWNYELTQHGKSHLISSYFPLLDPNNSLFADPLLYELESWGFFRVEGHTNLPLQDAISKIEAERKRLNIAFDIVCVPLDERTQKLQPATIFEDLESAFHQLRLEWILDLQTSKKDIQQADELLKFLQEMKGRKLHQLDIKALSDAVVATEEAEDGCKYKVVVHLHETYLARTTAPVFHRFAENHPGLEHLGGVQPGGTLVLVYDNSLTPDQPEDGAAKGSDTSRVVVADFCLPYLCCSKQQVGIPPAIFGFFPSGKLCFSDGAKQIFTWPSGGRISVRAEDKYFPDAAAISPSTGKWTFLPSGLPDEAFNEKDEATVKLSFIHLGKQMDIAETVFVSRITIMPSFEASAFWGVEKNVVHVRVENIQPENSSSNQKWNSTLLKDGIPSQKQQPTQTTPPFEIKVTSRELPTHVLINLEVTNDHLCSASFKLSVPIKTPVQETRSIEKSKSSEKSDDSTNKNKDDESGEQAERTGEPPDNNRQVVDNSEPLELKKIIDKRLDEYKLRYDALLEHENKADDIVRLKSRLFLFNPPNKTTTDVRFRKISESLLENFDLLEPSDRERRKQMIEVLAHCFLDKLFLLGRRNFDASVLPNREALELNGINMEVLFENWQGKELITGRAEGIPSR